MKHLKSISPAQKLNSVALLVALDQLWEAGGGFLGWVSCGGWRTSSVCCFFPHPPVLGEDKVVC